MKALDPETHLPFPELDWKWKMTNFFLEKWGRKFTFKLLQSIQPFVQVIVGKIANTEASTQLIGSAIGAAVLGCIDVIISYLTHGQAQSLQKIQEEAEEEPPLPRPDYNAFYMRQLSLKEAVTEKDTVPPRTWVVGWRTPNSSDDRPENRRYFDSLKSCELFIARLSDQLPKGQQAPVLIYEPGDELP